MKNLSDCIDVLTNTHRDAPVTAATMLEIMKAVKYDFDFATGDAGKQPIAPPPQPPAEQELSKAKQLLSRAKPEIYLASSGNRELVTEIDLFLGDGWDASFNIADFDDKNIEVSPSLPEAKEVLSRLVAAVTPPGDWVEKFIGEKNDGRFYEITVGRCVIPYLSPSKREEALSALRSELRAHRDADVARAVEPIASLPARIISKLKDVLITEAEYKAAAWIRDVADKSLLAKKAGAK